MVAVTEDGTRVAHLVDAVVGITGHLDLEEVLTGIVEAACAAVGARYAALGVVGGDRTLHRFVHTGLPADVVRDIGELPQGRGVLGLLIDLPEPLRLTDLRDHAQSVGFPPHHPTMGSFLGAPIKVGGEVFGHLYLTEKRDADAFSEEDEELVVALAAVAGVAIHNARLYETTRRRERWLEAVRDITRTLLERRGEEQLLREIASCARRLVGADVATLATAEDADSLRIRVADGATGHRLQGERFPHHRSITGEAMQSGTTIVVDDLTADPRAHQPLVAAGTYGPAMFVPLKAASGTFGTLSVANLQGGSRFAADDVEVLEILAAHVSIGLEYEEMQRRALRAEIVEERDRIGRDLQDSAIRRLLGAGLSLEQLATRARPADEALSEQLVELVDEIDRSLTDIRRMLFARPLRAPLDAN